MKMGHPNSYKDVSKMGHTEFKKWWWIEIDRMVYNIINETFKLCLCYETELK